MRRRLYADATVAKHRRSSTRPNLPAGDKNNGQGSHAGALPHLIMTDASKSTIQVTHGGSLRLGHMAVLPTRSVSALPTWRNERDARYGVATPDVPLPAVGPDTVVCSGVAAGGTRQAS